MNNDLKQFSEEKLQRYINQFAEDGMCDITDDEIMPLIRIALAAKQVKPIGIYNQQLFNLQGSAVMLNIDKSVEAGFVSDDGELSSSRGYLYTTPQPAHSEPDGWTKCSDQMPPSNEPVWAYAQPGFEYAVEAYWDGDWYRTLTDEPEYNITHWMPLPAAPKPESKA